MRTEVATALEQLKQQFSTSNLTVREDGQGGAYVIVDSIHLGTRYAPQETWIGFQIPAQYPYSDVYPVFVRGDLQRADGMSFVAPITAGHQFEGRPAIQVSRRSAAAQSGGQTVTTKVLKILDYLENIQ